MTRQDEDIDLDDDGAVQQQAWRTIVGMGRRYADETGFKEHCEPLLNTELLIHDLTIGQTIAKRARKYSVPTQDISEVLQEGTSRRGQRGGLGLCQCGFGQISRKR